VLAMASARMCRTSACRAGLLLRRAARQERAHSSFADTARFQEKKKRQSFVITTYGRQFRGRIVQ
jgi:hypothetical protein